MVMDSEPHMQGMGRLRNSEASFYRGAEGIPFRVNRTSTVFFDLEPDSSSLKIPSYPLLSQGKSLGSESYWGRKKGCRGQKWRAGLGGESFSFKDLQYT